MYNFNSCKNNIKNNSFLKNISLTVALFANSFLISGCQETYITNYKEINQQEKSITIPAGSGYGILSELKQKLKKKGWTILVRSGPSVSIANKNGDQVVTQAGQTSETKYDLEIEIYHEGVCLFGLGNIVTYDVTLIENDTKEEVFSGANKGCSSKISDIIFEQFNKLPNNSK
jgi:hypothetical protein